MRQEGKLPRPPVPAEGTNGAGGGGGVVARRTSAESAAARDGDPKVENRASRSPTLVPTTRYVDGSTHPGLTRCRESHGPDGPSSGSADVGSTERRLCELDFVGRSNESRRNSPASTPDKSRRYGEGFGSRCCTRRRRERGQPLRPVHGSTTPRASRPVIALR